MNPHNSIQMMRGAMVITTNLTQINNVSVQPSGNPVSVIWGSLNHGYLNFSTNIANLNRILIFAPPTDIISINAGITVPVNRYALSAACVSFIHELQLVNADTGTIISEFPASGIVALDTLPPNVDMLMEFEPAIPERVDFITNGTVSPLPFVLPYTRQLIRGGIPASPFILNDTTQQSIGIHVWRTDPVYGLSGTASFVQNFYIVATAANVPKMASILQPSLRNVQASRMLPIEMMEHHHAKQAIRHKHDPIEVLIAVGDGVVNHTVIGWLPTDRPVQVNTVDFRVLLDDDTPESIEKLKQRIMKLHGGMSLAEMEQAWKDQDAEAEKFKAAHPEHAKKLAEITKIDPAVHVERLAASRRLLRSRPAQGDQRKFLLDELAIFASEIDEENHQANGHARMAELEHVVWAAARLEAANYWYKSLQDYIFGRKIIGHNASNHGWHVQIDPHVYERHIVVQDFPTEESLTGPLQTQPMKLFIRFVGDGTEVESYALQEGRWEKDKAVYSAGLEWHSVDAPNLAPIGEAQ